MTLAPTLSTDRLVLRSMTAADFAAYEAFLASGRSVHMGGPLDTRAAWGMFCHDIALWTLYGHGALMADRRDGGGTAGQVGINAGPLFPEPELGWFLYDGHEGQGFATEAAARLRDWAFVNTDLPSLVSYMDQANTASARVAERLGATPDHAAARQDDGDLVYRHIRPGRVS